MTRRALTPATSGFAVAGPAETLALLASGGFQPVRSRWTRQPSWPELWLRVQEGRQFREMTDEPKKEA